MRGSAACSRCTARSRGVQAPFELGRPPGCKGLFHLASGWLVIPSPDLTVGRRVVRAPDPTHQDGAAAAEPMQANLLAGARAELVRKADRRALVRVVAAEGHQQHEELGVELDPAEGP